MAEFLDEKRNEIAARLKELKPLVDEYERLEAAAAALDGVPRRRQLAPRRRGAARSQGRSDPRRRGADEAKRRGRPKGSGTRGARRSRSSRRSPGITIPEIAEKMGIKQNYLYRVLPGPRRGRARRQGRPRLAPEGRRLRCVATADPRPEDRPSHAARVAAQRSRRSAALPGVRSSRARSPWTVIVRRRSAGSSRRCGDPARRPRRSPRAACCARCAPSPARCPRGG